MRINVVFPAPFSPITARISPGVMSSETSSTALTVPNDFEMRERRTSESHRNLQRAGLDLADEAIDFGHGLR